MEYLDKEITSIAYNKEEAMLTLAISDICLVCNDVEWWKLSSFDFQNVVFEINVFSNKNIPTTLVDEFDWVNSYLTNDVLKFVNIDSSVGMYGVIVAGGIQEIFLERVGKG